MSMWHEGCLGHCEDCLAAATCKNRQQHSREDSYKRFMTIGPVRYGMRVGSVSPPPPGAGPRYRSQSCWPTSPCGDGDCDSVPVSRIPLLTATPINNSDIFSHANRMRLKEKTSSDKLRSQQASATVRDHILNSGKCLINTELKRYALVRPQVYTRLAEYREPAGNKEENTLDRLPRFRFGGNRAAAAEKKTTDKKCKDLTDRLKRGTVPVPPPRTRHNTGKATQPASPLLSQDSVDTSERLRSASFSQVDYCTDYNKYVRRKPSTNQELQICLPTPNQLSPLPNPKQTSRPTTPTLGITSLTVTVTDTESDSKDEIHPEISFTDLNKDTSPDKIPEKLTRSPAGTSSDQGKKRDKSKRRKGIYISQWPNTKENIPQFVEDIEKNIEKLEDEKNKDVFIWSSPQEEPLSPEEHNVPPDWPTAQVIPRLKSPQLQSEKESLDVSQRSLNLFRSDSLSEGEADLSERKSDQVSLAPSDVSDCESRVSISTEPASPNVPRKYSKRPLRGPYGQMLEAEMKRPESRINLNRDSNFLDELAALASATLPSLSKPKHVRSRGSGNSSLDETSTVKEAGPGGIGLYSPKQNKRKVSAEHLIVVNENDRKLVVNHQRTASSPSKLDDYSNREVSSELLEHLLRGSSEQASTADAHQRMQNDTRTHVVVELYDNERSYVESLEIIVKKYLEPLKAPENMNLLDASLVDEIFSQVPSLLSHHTAFLDDMKKRLEQWDSKQKIGDIFLEMFSKPDVIETYTNYVNGWKRGRDILKNAQQSKPAFSKFLEFTARQHSGKLALDSLLIKPIQKFPRYELLLQRLIKHTDENHPDHNFLLAAQQLMHEQLIIINCNEKEALELDHLRGIEGLIDGLMELATPERQYIRQDSVNMCHGGGPRKERALFLFSDLLLITGIKRRSGTIRRPTTTQGSVTSTLEANKYKLLMRVPLEDIEIIRSKDNNLRQTMIECDNLSEDISTLNQVNELAWSLHCSHSQLDEVVKDMLTTLNKQLTEQQNSDSQLSCLDLTILTPNGLENISIAFSRAEKRTSWEESLLEAKQKLAMSGDRRPCPELLATVPIRKTRAGLQFTCAAPTLSESGQDVWVCNSDGYVGQVCVLSLTPEPTVTSCNGVCNARILCIASVPGINNKACPDRCKKKEDETEDHKTMHFDSSSSSDDDENCDSEHIEHQRLINFDTDSVEIDEVDSHQSTIWLGTEDCCIYVYNSGDNIRIRKNKVKLQLGAPVLCIIYLDNRVFVSLGNGDISVYDRDTSGTWNISCPTTCTVGSVNTPIAKLVPSANEKLWCACGSSIKIFNIHTFTTENSFTVNNDNNKSITSILLYGNSVWLSLQNSVCIKCYHAQTFELLCEMNVAPVVTKMLTSCDDIIRQHKAACLRVTSLVTCKELLWIGTSAGILLTMPLPHVSSVTTKLSSLPVLSGVPHGHTGHVRFLTSVEMHFPMKDASHRNSCKVKQDQRSNMKLLVISGGDGYEDFKAPSLSEVAGREDSTNYLLLWSI